MDAICTHPSPLFHVKLLWQRVNDVVGWCRGRATNYKVRCGLRAEHSKVAEASEFVASGVFHFQEKRSVGVTSSWEFEGHIRRPTSFPTAIEDETVGVSLLHHWVRANFHRTRVVMEFQERDRKSTRLNSSHSQISYAVFCLK